MHCVRQLRRAHRFHRLDGHSIRHKQPDSQAKKDGQLQSNRGQPTIPAHPGYFRSPLPYP
ncbi:hypothetical protein A6R68_13696 [Neotoma lepida]|uniref:Uncharacterized protein n=1 Tax=Neotoma lepida TaxID=56216 RepID=A0A1A6GZH0_NEOLE|nr:hypothetical protein A6R68_13696 [Neotoma lepida]